MKNASQKIKHAIIRVSLDVCDLKTRNIYVWNVARLKIASVLMVQVENRVLNTQLLKLHMK